MNLAVSVKLCVSNDTHHPEEAPQTPGVLLLRLCVALLISHGSASVTLLPSKIRSIGSRLLHSGLVSGAGGCAVARSSVRQRPTDTNQPSARRAEFRRWA